MSDKTNVQILLETHFQQLAKDQLANNEFPVELHGEVFDTLEEIEVISEEVSSEATADLNGGEQAPKKEEKDISNLSDAPEAK